MLHFVSRPVYFNDSRSMPIESITPSSWVCRERLWSLLGNLWCWYVSFVNLSSCHGLSLSRSLPLIHVARYSSTVLNVPPSLPCLCPQDCTHDIAPVLDLAMMFMSSGCVKMVKRRILVTCSSKYSLTPDHALYHRNTSQLERLGRFLGV